MIDVGLKQPHIKNAHLCFKQAQPKMCHCPKVDDGVEHLKNNLLNTYFQTCFVKNFKLL